nr:hypothetical protein [Candidatus Dependentiae bacterium]
PLHLLKSGLTPEQADFLKQAYQAKKERKPLSLASRTQCDVLLSFESSLLDYLKDAFSLVVNPSCLKASYEAQKDILV